MIDRDGTLNARFFVFANNRPLVEGGSVVSLTGRGPSYVFLTFAGTALVSSRFYRRLVRYNGFNLTLSVRNARRAGSNEHNSNTCRAAVGTVGVLGGRNYLFNASIYCASTGCRTMADSRFCSGVVRTNTGCV